jgi:putative NADH-flavin reductase
MRIVLFGTGFVGDALARELTARGHALTAVARRPSPAATATGSVHDPSLVAEVTAGAEVIVSALPPIDDDGGLAASTPVLVTAAKATGARLGIVGTSALLPLTTGGPPLAETPGFPDWLAPRVAAHHHTLELLGSTPHSVDWLYLAPAAEFGPHVRSARTGRYRIATTQLIDPDGRSWIGVADYALAFADELERPTVHRGLLVVGY